MTKIELPSTLTASASLASRNSVHDPYTCTIALYFGEFFVFEWTGLNDYTYLDSPYAQSEIEEFVAGKLRKLFALTEKS